MWRRRRKFPKPVKKDDTVIQTPTPSQLPPPVCPTEGTCAQCPMWDVMTVFDEHLQTVPARNNRGLRVGFCKAEFPRAQVDPQNGEIVTFPPTLENGWCYPGKVLMERLRMDENPGEQPAEPERKYSELS
jgi:hypothetical protein